MKKSLDYHDPRAKNIIIKAMTESHMIHHYRKIQNVIPYVDTNIRKKASIQRYVVRCQCGNRIVSNKSIARRNYQQNQYRKHVEDGVPCSRYRKCFNDNIDSTVTKSCNKSGKSKLKMLTHIYHPPRNKSFISSKHEEVCCQSDSDSEGYNSNSDDSSKPDPDHIDLLKKITDDILNNSLYTSGELKTLFQEHIRLNENYLSQEEIHNLEQELKFVNEPSPCTCGFDERYELKSLKTTSYPSFKLEDLNINPKTLASIKEALNIRQTEDSCSQTYRDSLINSNEAIDKDNEYDLHETSDGELALEEHSKSDEALTRHSTYNQVNKDETIKNESREHSKNSYHLSNKDDDLESLDDFSSIHSYQDS